MSAPKTFLSWTSLTGVLGGGGVAEPSESSDSVHCNKSHSLCLTLKEHHCWFTKKGKHKEPWRRGSMGQTLQSHATQQWPSTLKSFCSVQVFTLHLLHANTQTWPAAVHVSVPARSPTGCAAAASGGLTAKHRERRRHPDNSAMLSQLLKSQQLISASGWMNSSSPDVLPSF